MSRVFGAYEQTDPPAFLMSVPEIAWEATLGVYLIVKGFRPSPSTRRMRAPSCKRPVRWVRDPPSRRAERGTAATVDAGRVCLLPSSLCAPEQVVLDEKVRAGA